MKKLFITLGLSLIIIFFLCLHQSGLFPMQQNNNSNNSGMLSPLNKSLPEKTDSLAGICSRDAYANTHGANKPKPKYINNIHPSGKETTLTIDKAGNEQQYIFQTAIGSYNYSIAYDAQQMNLATIDLTDRITVNTLDPLIYPEVSLTVSYCSREEMSFDENYAETTIGSACYPACYSIVSEGSSWDSPVIENYLIDYNDGWLQITLSYFNNAEEGWGAQLKAMLSTFTLLDPIHPSEFSLPD